MKDRFWRLKNRIRVLGLWVIESKSSEGCDSENSGTCCMFNGLTLEMNFSLLVRLYLGVLENKEGTGFWKHLSVNLVMLRVSYSKD